MHEHAATHALKLALAAGVITLVALQWTYTSHECSDARQSLGDGSGLRISNMLCCPAPYAIGAVGCSVVVFLGLAGSFLEERGAPVATAATAALGQACCCCGGCAR